MTFCYSPDFQKVLSTCFDEAFDLLFKQIRPTFFAEAEARIPRSGVSEIQEGQAEPATENNDAGKAIPLAGVIPVVSRLVHHVVNGVPNIFLEVVFVHRPVHFPIYSSPTTDSLNAAGVESACCSNVYRMGRSSVTMISSLLCIVK